MKDTETAVSATDILPDLYNGYFPGKSNVEDKVDDLNYDLYNLVCCDYHTLAVKGSEDRDSVILESAQRACQLLMKRIFECPTEPSFVGPLAILPEPTTKIPREKRIPESKSETKWEKFAREKNIKKKKKDRMIYDEASGEYKPRWGYKAANNGIEDHAIVEVKAGQDPFADPWAAEKEEKKQRVQKNLKKQVRNMSRNGEGKVVKASYDPASMPGIPPELTDRSMKRGKDGVRRALQLVQHSTASMGRFDDMRKGEPERKIRGKKRSFRDNMSSSTLDHEKSQMKSQLRIVADKVEKKRKGVTNSLAPYEGIIPDAPSESFKQKKGKGKASSGDGPKKKKVKRS